jgi:UDP-2,3-diacylglucosamine hydrolase
MLAHAQDMSSHGIIQAGLGIVAGKGDLPRRLIQACQRKQRPFLILAIHGETDPDLVEGLPHIWFPIGAIGKAIASCHDAGVTQVVMAGRIERPPLKGLMPDAAGARLLARLGRSLFAGDNRLLSTVVSFLEEEGIEVVGVEDVLDNILMPEGPIGRNLPDKESVTDIEFGVKVAKEIGRLDIGQAVIVQHGYVLGVEAVEGTDALIARCEGLKMVPKGGVLIKVCKPDQEKRVDLPTIGVKTVENIAKAGFAGIAAEAGKSLIIGRDLVERRANELGVFVIGFSLAETAEGASALASEDEHD